MRYELCRLKGEPIAPLAHDGLTPARGIRKLRDSGVLRPNRAVSSFGIAGLSGYAVHYFTLPACGARVAAFDLARDLSKASEQRDLDAVTIDFRSADP